jgi:hypothetical protein
MDPYSWMRVACAAGKNTEILIDDAKKRYEELRPNVRDALTRISRAYFRFRRRFEHDLEHSLPRPTLDLPRNTRSVLEHTLSSPVPYDEDTLILSRGKVQAHEKKIEKARDELKNITDYMEYMVHIFQDILVETLIEDIK